MNQTLVQTNVGWWRRVRQTNSTDTAFTARVGVLEETGTIIESLGTTALHSTSAARFRVGQNGFGANCVKFMPFGIGADGNTFDMRVIGWLKTADTPVTWIPTVIGQFACTVSSTLTGLAGGSVLNTEYFADTIAPTYGSSVGIDVVSPANDVNALIAIDLRGFELVEVQFDVGTITSANALYSTF